RPSSGARGRASACPSPRASSAITADSSRSTAPRARGRRRPCSGRRARVRDRQVSATMMRRRDPMAKPRALIVDDVVDMADTIARDLEGVGFVTETAASGPIALARFAAAPADVVVTDLRMKGGDGLELLSALKAADPSVPVVIMTAFGAVESAVEAMQRGAFHYITKPFSLDA